MKLVLACALVWAALVPARLCADDVPGRAVEKSALAARTFRVEKDTALVKGGVNEKYLFSDDQGSLWLFKPMPAHEAAIEEACYRLGAALGLKTPEVFGVSAAPGLTGSLSRILQNKGNLKKRPPDVLTARQVQQVLEIQVFDWLIGDFDTHERNFLVDLSDDVVTIDHGLAFTATFFDFDLGAGPRYTMQSYFHALWNAYKAGKLRADPAVVWPFVDRVARMPDATLASILRPFAAMRRRALGYVMKDRYGDRVHRTEDEFLFAMARRKAGLRDAVAAMLAHMARERGRGEAAPPPPSEGELAYAVPELDPEPLALRVVDEHHRFGLVKRVGRRIKIETATLREVGVWGVLRALEQKVITAVDGVRHVMTPVVYGGLTAGLVTTFDFEDELDPTLAERIARTGADVLKLFRERAAFGALHGATAAARARARQVLAMIARVSGTAGRRVDQAAAQADR